MIVNLKYFSSLHAWDFWIVNQWRSLLRTWFYTASFLSVCLAIQRFALFFRFYGNVFFLSFLSVLFVIEGGRPLQLTNLHWRRKFEIEAFQRFCLWIFSDFFTISLSFHLSHLFIESISIVCDSDAIRWDAISMSYVRNMSCQSSHSQVIIFYLKMATQNYGKSRTTLAHTHTHTHSFDLNWTFTNLNYHK